MNKQQIIDHIYRIVNNTQRFITADEIYATLTHHVEPGRTQETIKNTYARWSIQESI